eukprot:scaffold27005_cov132-Isochrysis_galbana.AAC.6
MERSSGPPQTTDHTQGACAAAPPLVDLAPSPPGFAPTVLFYVLFLINPCRRPHHAAPTAASFLGRLPFASPTMIPPIVSHTFT